ncbi:hypothetical protein CC79DRAFT_707 [Sarocladium strictum]
MSRPNLLLCFDAFGTLFKPIRPVAQQYADVARQCGLTNLSDDEVKSSFSKAFKHEAKTNPNYGRATGLGATQWWTNVIHNTFDSVLRNGEVVPQDLAPRLIHRFGSSEGYETEPDLVASLRSLRTSKSRHFSNIAIGVLTNTDDVVPAVLSDFGLRVSPLRYGMDEAEVPEEEQDIDFHCMSYDVGHEKPDKRMFSAAESMLAKIIESRKHQLASDEAESLESNWTKILVGDEYEKDVEGSVNAGWNAILLDPANESPRISRLEDHLDLSLAEVTNKGPAMRVQSIGKLATWLAQP